MTFGAPYYDADVDRVVVSATAVSVVNGGTGYAVGQRVRPRANEGSPGSTLLRATVRISQVGAGGTVLGVELAPVSFAGGRYAIDNGIIESVENLFSQAGWRKVITNPDGVLVTNGGVYYREDESNRTVTVNSGGRYYREDASLPPYVATVTVGVNQTAPSQGSGAIISATVGSDPENAETFGKITGLTINNGGTGYLAHELFPSCLGRFNGRSIVVRRNYPFWRSGQCCPFFPMSISPEECTYGYTCANTGDPCSLEAEAVRVEYRGPNEPMTVFLMLHQRGQTTLPLGGDYYYPAAYGSLTANENVGDCSSMDVTAYGTQWLPPESAAHITAGGTYEESDACRKITTEDMAAVYVDVSWGSITTSGSGGNCGWRSGVGVASTSQDTTGSWCGEWKQSIPTNTSTSCSESRSITDFGLSFHRNNYCEWNWAGGYLCVGIQRYASIGHPNTGGRFCAWCYPINKVEYDENLIPTGIQLGDPSYSTTSGFNFGTGEPPAEFFGNLLTEQTVCQNPGTPTVTISSLP